MKMPTKVRPRNSVFGWHALHSAGGLCVLLFWSTLVHAQSERPVSTEFIPQDAVAMAVLFPKQIAKDPHFELLPREIITAWGKQEFGFDPIELRQISFAVGRLESMEQPPQWGAVLSFDKIQGLSENLLARMDERKLRGKKLYRAREQGMPSILVFDESTMFIGDESFFEKMLAADGSGDLVKMVERSRLRGQLYAFGDVTKVRGLIDDQISKMGRVPPPFEKFAKIHQLVDGIELTVDAKGQLTTDVLLHCADDERAGELREILVEGLALVKQMLLAQMSSEMDVNDPIQEATMRYAHRIGNVYEQRLTPQLKGKSLALRLENEAAATPMLIGMLLPAVQQTRSAARRASSMNNGRQLLLSLHNYHEANKAFPAQANYDQRGRPLLSWRVHILPYLDERELYEAFRLDEPWDSPHNKKLIERMPDVFRSPDANLGTGKTIYLGVSGDGMMFSEKPLRLESVTDGTSNTVMIVEADPGEAVTWTKPEDYEVDMNRPLKGLGGIRPVGFSAVFADGSVRVISPSIEVDVWKAMLTVSGGEPVDRF